MDVTDTQNVMGKLRLRIGQELQDANALILDHRCDNCCRLNFSIIRIGVHCSCE